MPQYLCGCWVLRVARESPHALATLQALQAQICRLP